MKKRLYISGKIRGEDEAACKVKFYSVQLMLEARGFEVVNPLELVGNWDAPRNEALSKCLIVISKCDALYMLPDWEDSEGARIEASFARQIGVWRIYENIENTAQ